jgi:hypothetical protein
MQSLLQADYLAESYKSQSVNTLEEQWGMSGE